VSLEERREKGWGDEEEKVEKENVKSITTRLIYVVKYCNYID
jgi:hypothetical protein